LKKVFGLQFVVCGSETKNPKPQTTNLAFQGDSRVLHNGGPQTPSGPEGSSGSGTRRVLQGRPAITRGREGKKKVKSKK
jgi:hypothetical protein